MSSKFSSRDRYQPPPGSDDGGGCGSEYKKEPTLDELKAHKSKAEEELRQLEKPTEEDNSEADSMQPFQVDDQLGKTVGSVAASSMLGLPLFFLKGALESADRSLVWQH